MRYFFTYKTTNNINGKYYLGVHSTSNLDDGYLGSGTVITEAFSKYGKENFTREILRFYDSGEEAYKAEAELITERDLKDPNCYNISTGGRGGSYNSVHFYVPGGKKYLVRSEAVPKFLEEHPEAIQGMTKDVIEASRLRNLGKKLVSKGLKSMMVPESEVKRYLEDGWKLGASDNTNLKNRLSKEGFKVMHKGSVTKHVKPCDVSSFLKEGYEFGPAKWLNEKQGKGHRGLLRISRGSEEKMVPADSLNSWLEQGYVKGPSKFRKKLEKGKVNITKGTVTRKVNLEQLSTYLEQGWIRGRSKKTVDTLSRLNKGNSEERKLRIREEASTRRIIYQKSSRFGKWWESNSKLYKMPQYGVHHFLDEIGSTKGEFLDEMKKLGEI